MIKVISPALSSTLLRLFEHPQVFPITPATHFVSRGSSSPLHLMRSIQRKTSQGQVFLLDVFLNFFFHVSLFSKPLGHWSRLERIQDGLLIIHRCKRPALANIRPAQASLPSAALSSSNAGACGRLPCREEFGFCVIKWEPSEAGGI